MKKTLSSLKKYKRRKNYCSRYIKRSAKDVLKKSVQENSLITNVFEKIYNLYFRK